MAKATEESFMNWLLSILFPPGLPGKVRDWHERVEQRTDEQGWAGNVREKQFRDAIQRHWAERSVPVRLFSREYYAQMQYAQMDIAELERDLIARGYVNTIHDCWEKKD